MSGERYDTYEPERYGCVAVDDQWVEPLAEKLREYTRMYGRLHDCGEINFEHNSVVPHEYCGKNADTQKRYKLLVRAVAEYLDSVDN